MDPIAVHFHEIALKGKNRRVFEAQLRQNLKAALKDLAPATVRSSEGRVFVDIDADPAKVLPRIQNVFGVAHCFVARRVERDLDKVGALVLEAVREKKPATFRVLTRRNDKKYPHTSVEVDREVGRIVHEATGTPVKLSGAELVAHVVILADEVLVGTDRHDGVGGLPTGTGGRVATLLSGGIDSPVAAWRMMKRGCHIDFVHFHSHPLVDRRSIEKAEELVEILTRWQFTSRLHLVPLAQMQTQARLKAPEALRVLLYRRFMVRMGERIARRNRCRALITGESLGQVASQTLANIAAVDAVATMPVLRPLVGFDKQEIIDEAMRLTTFEISVQPDQDCCRLFLPRKPAIHATAQECAAAEEELDVPGLVDDAVARTETMTFRWPGE